jgi:hypothetical protein
MVTDSSLCQVLKSISWPQDRRYSVRRSLKDKKKGFVLGRVLDYARGFAVSRALRIKEYEELCKMLNSWARSRFPGFNYSSIQLNAGGSALHVDRMNCGPSLIKAWGHFKGGRLWVMDSPTKLIDVKRTGKIMDGNAPHITMPYTGQRFSAVFFHMKGSYRELAEKNKRYLRKLGFPLPMRRTNLCSIPRSRELPDAAKYLRDKFGLSRKYIGDYNLKSQLVPTRTRRPSSAAM